VGVNSVPAKYPILRAAAVSTIGFAFVISATWPARGAEFDLFTGLGTLGGTTSNPNGISADGTVVVGESRIANGITHAFRWSGGVMTDLGTLGGFSSWATQTSADGAVVVGYADTAASNTHAFRWSGGVMTDLGTLGGSTSMGFAVSANGAIVAGQSNIVGDAATHAFRYSNGVMTDLGTLGGSFSTAFGISADGSVVVGRSTIANGEHRPFRWSNGVMTDLGTFGGTYSSANGVSADGSVVVGYSGLASGGYRAFRWSNGVMANLGTANGGTNSYGTAVSADGSVVVGASNTTSNSAYRAMRWTAATGMRLIGDLLTASGVNTTGWVLTVANGVSGDGSVIAGTGTNPSGNTEAWIVRCTSACALLSSGTVSRSFSGQSAIGQTASAAIGFTLGTMTEVATQTNANRTDGSRYSVFGYGGYDTDPAASGTLGMTASLSDQTDRRRRAGQRQRRPHRHGL
jgi:probable HAF family extracellular repeat protein